MKKVLLILMSFVLLMSFVGCGEDDRGGSDSEDDNSNMSVSKTDANTPKETSEIGSIIKFGRYEQDNDLSNGTEEIEWIVLEKENNRMFVISKYALDGQKYDAEVIGPYNWETCTLRSWLNDAFIDNAFSDAEKSKILTSTVTAEDNLTYGTDAGNDTQDKVFLLSISEVNRYMNSLDTRKCFPTAFADSRGVFVDVVDQTCFWFLRSPGETGFRVAYVNYDGEVIYIGYPGYQVEIGVRPAMWIELD